MTSTETVVRWGIVGLGGVVVDSIAPAMARLPGSRLVACAGRTLEKSRAFAERFRVERVYRDHDELAADPDVDAVYIATPNGLHHAAVLAAARAKKHVLCEKPFALTVEDGREMVEACRSASVILRVAFQIRLEKALQRAREIILSGTLGELRSIAFERTAPLGQRGDWRKDPRQGGIVFDVAVHQLDLVPWLTGLNFREVCAFSYPHRRGGRPDETAAILGRLGDSCNVVIRASRELPFARNDLIVEGTQGMLATSALRWVDEYVLQIRNRAGLTEERFVPVPTYQREIEVFEGEIRGVRSLLPTGEEAVDVIKLTSAVLESIESGRTVTVC